MHDKQIRYKQRLESYKKALSLLVKQSGRVDFDDENIAATLHFYETAFELSWKLLKDYLEYQGIIAKSPREVIKMAFQMGYIRDGEIWLEMLDARNNITHIYEESMARKFFIQVKEVYISHLVELGKL